MEHMTTFARSCYKDLYPELFGRFEALVHPRQGYTLYEASFGDCYSTIEPNDVDLSVQIGPAKLNVPIISAAMDTVSGEHMARAMFEIGGCGIIYRTKKPHQQIDWISRALQATPCLVNQPKYVTVKETLEEVQAIHDEGYSNIPVVDGGKLMGMIFTRDISYKDHLGDSVTKWMMKRSKLKVVGTSMPFERVRERLLNEQNCNLLPVVDKNGKLHGMFFMKDMFNVDPAWHGTKRLRKPLVGMAVGVSDADVERVQEGLRLGVGMIIIDSSHGNCEGVINQAKRIVKLAKGKAAVVAGNVAGIDGYHRLHETGVEAVKAGIGSGSICTTSQVTGAGVPMWTLIRELAFARSLLVSRGEAAPAIIADGGIGGPGLAARALVAGADAVMAGEWLVAATESISHQQGKVQVINGQEWNYYRGMASAAAIKARVSDRYGKGKTAAEGVEGYVPCRGPLKTWIGHDLQLVRGGFAHVGAKNLAEAHARGEDPMTWVVFTGAGQQQVATRV